MGVSGISIWQLLIVLLIVVLIFGTKRIKNIGSDLGGAIKSFRKGLNEAESVESDLSKIGEELNKDPKTAKTKATKQNISQLCLILGFGKCWSFAFWACLS